MSYNSRTNFADPQDDLPINEFLTLFAKACNIGWNNIKQKPPKNQCQFHGDKYLSNDEGQCVCQARYQTTIVDNNGNLKPILLCEMHTKLLNEQLGLNSET